VWKHQQTEFKRIVSPLKYQTRSVAAFPDQQGFLVCTHSSLHSNIVVEVWSLNCALLFYFILFYVCNHVGQFYTWFGACMFILWRASKEAWGCSNWYTVLKYLNKWAINALFARRLWIDATKCQCRGFI
jgi:hypothetical protein